MISKKQDSRLTQALCPQCWQRVAVHDNETYYLHGKLRQTGQEPVWCQMSNRPLEPLFPLGQQVMTIGAIDALQQAQQDPTHLLKRHQHGDWGNLDPVDAAENLRSVKTGLRLLSNYPLPTGETLWIITEWDRSVSTLLLPSEY